MDEEMKNEEISQDQNDATENVVSTSLDEKEKKIKNLISVVILLAGLFVGSLFVDIVQLIRGGGFSNRALSSTDVFQSNGKTWVAYSEPMVKVQVITDETCGEACKPDEVLVGLKGALPTMLTEKVDVNSEEGKKLVSTFNLKTLPAFVFSKEVEKTELFSKAQPFLDKQGESYAIKSAEAGFPVGKYISAPEISDNSIKIGSDDAKVKIVAFSYFQNPADKKLFQEIILPAIKEYGDQIQFAFKNYFPPSSPQAALAAMAGECANAQGKFMPYAEKLFATQASWGKQKDASASLKSFSKSVGLNSEAFNKCFDAKEFQSQISSELKEGESFGISATPAVFVGNELETSIAKYADIKKIIDQQLEK